MSFLWLSPYSFFLGVVSRTSKPDGILARFQFGFSGRPRRLQSRTDDWDNFKSRPSDEWSFAQPQNLFKNYFMILTFSHWARWWRQQTIPRALTICTENPEIPGRIQMERFFPVEIFRKKSNTFRGITFFPFLPKWPKFSVPFVLITSARLHVERKWEIYRYFVNGTTQSRSCFRCQKKTSTNWGKIFTDISVQW